jgi:DNA transformation protein
MTASSGFGEFLCEQLAPLGRVTMRRMFGKTGVFCNGLMFGMVTDDTLYVRVDDQNRDVFKEAQSTPPLNYEKKGATIDLSFWRVPERLLDEPDEARRCARAALARRSGRAKRKGVVPRRRGARRRVGKTRSPRPERRRPRSGVDLVSTNSPQICGSKVPSAASSFARLRRTTDPGLHRP